MLVKQCTLFRTIIHTTVFTVYFFLMFHKFHSFIMKFVKHSLPCGFIFLFRFTKKLTKYLFSMVFFLQLNFEFLTSIFDGIFFHQSFSTVPSRPRKFILQNLDDFKTIHLFKRSCKILQDRLL